MVILRTANIQKLLLLKVIWGYLLRVNRRSQSILWCEQTSNAKLVKILIDDIMNVRFMHSLVVSGLMHLN